MNPPSLIDNARVLWWAWSGDQPFGLCGDTEIYGIAICRYDSSGALYRFSCDRNWKTVNDSPHDDEDEAKAAVPLNYRKSLSRIGWQKVGTPQDSL